MEGVFSPGRHSLAAWSQRPCTRKQCPQRQPDSQSALAAPVQPQAEPGGSSWGVDAPSPQKRRKERASQHCLVCRTCGFQVWQRPTGSHAMGALGHLACGHCGLRGSVRTAPTGLVGHCDPGVGKLTVAVLSMCGNDNSSDIPTGLNKL